MRMRHSFVTTVGLAATLAAGATQADMLPTHGAYLYLDAFVPDGWSVPPPFPPPGPGELALTDDYLVLGPMSNQGRLGKDTQMGGQWHWENQFDLDPYPTGGAALVSFDLTTFGGPVTGPVVVPLLAGPDIYIDTDQPDQGFYGELGRFWKSFKNSSNIPVGWGQSVTEDLLLTPVDYKVEILLNGDPDFLLTVPVDPDWFICTTLIFCWQWELTFIDVDNTFVFRPVRHVPEPGSLAFFGLGLGGLALALRRRRRLPKA